ncbi:MAG: adenosylcobalamin-dependent ribonucleoside-diphosphate reductase, partial [Gammaproteobacteria bacterium]
HEAGPDATIRRVDRAVAAVEARDRDGWAARFLELMDGWQFLPGGRILAGAGTARRVTLFNRFVMGTITASLDGIFEALKEGALTMQQGGGVGYDFSTLRPRGSPAMACGTVASGPVSFMRIWDATCGELLSTGARRGAMMATLRCDHPDVLEFVNAKRSRGQLTRFNLSVAVTDDFMACLERGGDWPLVFPPGGEAPWVARSVPAQKLWEAIADAAWASAEPGVLFIDRINRENNLRHCEALAATNPCGEIPLPPYGACNLGSFNLTAYVDAPFTGRARLDLQRLAADVPLAVRFLDNVIDATGFPLPAQAEEARRTRRIGLGLTGLADALLMLGHRYDSDAGRAAATAAMKTITTAAYRASSVLAAERGPCPAWDAGAVMETPMLSRLPAPVRDAVAAAGLRNGHLTAIAPAGTISLLAGNVSSGVEPVFDATQRRRVLDADGRYREFDIPDLGVALWRSRSGDDSLPPGFVTARELAPEAHLAMQAALQPWVDAAISKTVNLPADAPPDTVARIYTQAWRLGLKGCTAFRPNPVTGEILAPVPEAPAVKTG